MYEDIVDLPHYRSPYRKPMSMESRAAQFAPFAALTGHDDAIAETARLTVTQIELTEEEKRHISRLITEAYRTRKPVSITYFSKDEKKGGGEYKTVTGTITTIDEIEQTLSLPPHTIPLSSILTLK